MRTHKSETEGAHVIQSHTCSRDVLFTIVFAGLLARDDKTSLLLAHTSRRSHSVLDLVLSLRNKFEKTNWLFLKMPTVH